MPTARALLRTSHPLPSLAITAMIMALVVQAAPHGVGPLAAAPCVLAGELSIGWSNDWCDAARDAAAGRRDKPLVNGAIGKRTVGIAALAGLALSLALGFAVNPATGLVNTVMMAAGWGYNAGLKATPLSAVAYATGFGLIPAFAAAAATGSAAATWQTTAAAVLLGLGGHFANVLADLDEDHATGVQGRADARDAVRDPDRAVPRAGPVAHRFGVHRRGRDVLGAVAGLRRRRRARRGRLPGRRPHAVPGGPGNRGGRCRIIRTRRGTPHLTGGRRAPPPKSGIAPHREAGPGYRGSMGMSRIAAVATALPPHRHRQAELADAHAGLLGMPASRRKLLDRLYANAGVDTRHTALPLADYERLDHLGTVNDHYVRHAAALGEEAVRRALARAGTAPAEVDMFVVTSVTGVAVPSLDAVLMPRLGLRSDVKRVPVFGLGCVAGAAGLARIHDYLLAWPAQTAVLLSVELCSLSVPLTAPTAGDLVVSALFGDGAGAAVVRGEQAAARSESRSALGIRAGRRGPRRRGPLDRRHPQRDPPRHPRRPGLAARALRLPHRPDDRAGRRGPRRPRADGQGLPRRPRPGRSRTSPPGSATPAARRSSTRSGTPGPGREAVLDRPALAERGRQHVLGVGAARAGEDDDRPAPPGTPGLLIGAGARRQRPSSCCCAGRRTRCRHLST